MDGLLAAMAGLFIVPQPGQVFASASLAVPLKEADTRNNAELLLASIEDLRLKLDDAVRERDEASIDAVADVQPEENWAVRGWSSSTVA